MAFRYDTRHLTTQQQAIINQRDRNEQISKEASERKKQQVSQKYKTAIFMKLGQDATGKYSGMETLRIYYDFAKKMSNVWFSTNSLASGMSKTKVAEYDKAIQGGESVYIYYAVGKNVEGTNDIVYKAKVKKIVSNSVGISSPNNELTPDEWKNLKNKIWIKISDMREIDNLKASDFVVASTGRDLGEVITKSQYHFGYIKLKKKVV